MLVLSRKKGESIIINDNVKIVVVEIRGDKVRLGVEAPEIVPVHRQEVYDAIKRQQQRAQSCSKVPNPSNGEPSKPTNPCDPPLSKITKISKAG